MISEIKSRIKRVEDWSGITGWILASMFTIYFLFNVNLGDFIEFSLLLVLLLGALVYMVGLPICTTLLFIANLIGFKWSNYITDFFSSAGWLAVTVVWLYIWIPRIFQVWYN